MLTELIFLAIGLTIGYIIKQQKKEDDRIFVPAPIYDSSPNKSVARSYDPLTLLDPQHTLEMDENGELFSPYEELYREEHKEESAWKENASWNWENNEKERALWH